VYVESTHGTWVLSIIGANIPGKLVGTAPEADFLLLRSEDVESEWRVEEINWIVAAEFADSAGADVINASLAYSLFDLDEQNYSTSDMDGNTTWVTRGADLAARKGMLVVVSAGNSGDEPWRIITAPADGDSVLTVGAVDSEGAYVSFSSQGPTADDRVKPNVMAQGRRVYIQKSNGEITARGGTSFSAPIMTGLATCLWQRFPDKTNQEIIKILERASSNYPYPNDTMGYGIPNMDVAIKFLTSTQSEPENGEIRSFPNPVEDIIGVILDDDDLLIGFEIIDMSGKVLQRISFPETFEADGKQMITVDPGITPGIYIAKIITVSHSYAVRFLKK
ncbi:MAG TPA: T9SS type A sorting domain-containing protein, partial [Bacteroides sp.]|nr:T9SS type A sorting domain-containing protein [Bacteroides sp.]